MQQLVTFTKLPGGVLRIAIAGKTVRQKNANRKEIIEIAQNERWGTDRQFLEVCEYELCNGWSELRPEDVVALTDSILFSDDCKVGDDGTLTYCGDVYWNRNYQVRSEIDDLLRDGYVDFHCESNVAEERAGFLAECVHVGNTERSEVVGMYFEERWDEDGSVHATPIDRYYCIHCASSMKLWNYMGATEYVTRHTESIYTHTCDGCDQLLEDVEVQNIYQGVEGWQGQPRLAL